MEEEVVKTGDSKHLGKKDESEGNTTLKVPSAGEKRKLSETCATPKFTIKPKISMNISGSQQKKTIGVSLKLGADPKKQKTEPTLVEKKGSVASAFDEESDDEEEEMPAEAKMRMRNIGRNTPTSAGPNSYNKGNKGFTDHRKAGEKSFKLEHPSRSRDAKE
ncbi:PEST proteolytic signal-containing nuclear protein-like [Stylophora pistillata]|uniref:PEST proteolytic signal-containing nuclear protein n=1 Tax=Stylophora pistillata TaxID=50429 RepID=A0A2B4T195_STYPI|nr:PEST proteolytic signal-containing nuclear protein-like [Stylophora pistillata]PFX34558.1 PEST proteolytic signal-containing nuclear protein [Stylophora pistillata]